MIYSTTEVVNHNNVLNNPNCNVFNGINHQLQQQPQRQLQPPPQQQLIQQNSELIKTNNSNLIAKNQPIYSNDSNLTPTHTNNNLHPNSLPSISKNTNNHLNDSVVQKYYSSPPPNYQFHNQQQQPPTNACFIDTKKSINNSNGLNYFNNDTNNLIKSPPPILDSANKIPLDNISSNNNSLNNKNNNNYNSISSSNFLNSPSSKSQLNELNDSLTVDLKGTKQKAETKTLYLLKIIDQIVVNGVVVKEVVIKDDELVKHTGFIDWPETNQTDLNNSSNNFTKLTSNENSKNDNSSKNDKFTTTATAKKNTTPKNSKNLKRSSSSNSQTKDKEKKVKTEINLKIKIDNTKINQQQQHQQQTNAKLSSPSIKKEEITVKEIKSPENKQITNDSLIIIDTSNITTDIKQQPQQLQQQNPQPQLLQQQNQLLSTSPKIVSSVITYEIEDPIFKPIVMNQKVLAKWNDKNYYSGTVISKENDSKWRIGFDDGGRRMVRENEIISIECLPKGQQVMCVMHSHANYCAKGIVKSHRFDMISNEKYYLIEYIVNLKYLETEYSEKDVFLTGDYALSLLSRRKQNLSDSKFADVDLNNIIPKGRARIAFKNEKNLNDMPTTSSAAAADSSLNDKTLAKLEIENNDSNSNLSTSSTNNSSATTTSSSTKKSTNKKSKTTVAIANKQQQNSLLNEADAELSPTVNLNALNSKSNLSNLNNLDLKEQDTAKNEAISVIQKEEEDLKLISFKNDNSFDDNLIGPLEINPTLFKGFSFLLSFEDQKEGSDEIAGFSIPFDLDHLTKQIKNGSGLILDKYEDTKVCLNNELIEF